MFNLKKSSYLLGYEFTDTMICLSENKIIFFLFKKKSKIFFLIKKFKS